MFKMLEENAVPLLIFSAGLGDVIEEILKDQGRKAPNMHIISNRFQFDENVSMNKARFLKSHWNASRYSLLMRFTVHFLVG
jgi:2-hydroxy-3-keto-5-methylthiopentenyl-1-phosphate phosphatase